jgi:hypothetical protein
MGLIPMVFRNASSARGLGLCSVKYFCSSPSGRGEDVGTDGSKFVVFLWALGFDSFGVLVVLHAFSATLPVMNNAFSKKARRLLFFMSTPRISFISGIYVFDLLRFGYGEEFG